MSSCKVSTYGYNDPIYVRYDEDFYKSLSSGQFQTVIAHDTTTNAVIGIITGLKRTKAESDVIIFQPPISFPKDSEGVLPVTWFDRGLLTYVLTLCVTGAYRKRGIGKSEINFKTDAFKHKDYSNFYIN